jgi:hypothetical protein
MKTIFNFPLKLLSIILISITFFGITSCSKDNNDNNGMYVISGSSNGSQVVPSVNGTATGTITGTYNANTNLLTYNMTWAGLTASASSSAFYTGSPGTNGALFENTTITTSGSTGASVGTVTLTDAQETALLNGSMYYVVGTPTHTSGEIRGQITATAQ